jgi:hypothetical protein
VYLKSLVKFQQSGASILGLDASQNNSSLSHFLQEDGKYFNRLVVKLFIEYSESGQ